MKGIYVHIPFCEYICKYCDFVKQIPKDQKTIDIYLEKLTEEINSYREHFDSIKTIYIGGGTPSMLTTLQLKKLFESLKQIDPIEYTIELNPESYTDDKGKLFKEYGVNRVSIGVQTFNQNLLNYLGRAHKKETVIEVVRRLKLVGIERISIDLIFGIPGQTIDLIKEDIHQFKQLGIGHLSYYSLILEDKTYFYHQYLRGKFVPIDEELEGSMYELIINELNGLGYQQYEISNFTRNGEVSLHNLIYWNLDEYIGVGLGAHGFLNNIRTQNERSMNKYLDHIRLMEVSQTESDLLADELIFGLRKTNGVNLSKINEKYRIDLIKEYPKLKEYIDLELLTLNNGQLSLTIKGIMIGNQIFMLFV